MIITTTELEKLYALLKLEREENFLKLKQSVAHELSELAVMDVPSAQEVYNLVVTNYYDSLIATLADCRVGLLTSLLLEIYRESQSSEQSSEQKE